MCSQQDLLKKGSITDYKYNIEKDYRCINAKKYFYYNKAMIIREVSAMKIVKILIKKQVSYCRTKQKNFLSVLKKNNLKRYLFL